ncbi:MAG: hypothetical protein QOD02_4867 [Mycobacterium sp.]|nr:hypothetical protein [Mycobacterium sp.]MDT5305048.1 hypothetical protein [Mycobacterium sp.]MDT7736816.1 hypothetical protein [Mycobacterium sp.]MDT7770840.1 hypothetical protein [Mycobacterium sp.]
MSDSEGRLACIIGADGTIARDYRIVKCEYTGIGDYAISWEDELQGFAKTNFSRVVGSTMYEDVDPGIFTVGLLTDPHEMRVRTYALNGQAADRPFHLAVFRD